MSNLNRKKCNFSVKLHPNAKRNSTEVNNAKLVKKFMKKFKESGIVKELRQRQAPMTKGQKNRLKKHIGKRRAQKAQQRTQK